MTDATGDYLTTRELAELLRIKERKVYDLAASGDVPCVRVVGKLLFPRDAVAAWIGSSRSGPDTAGTPMPAILAGSHDPLLEWALRDSGSGLAAFFDGSHDGLTRCAGREAVACGLHVREPGGWNVQTVRAAVGDRAVVLVEFARRQRGLVVAPGNPRGITGLRDLHGLAIARRQPSSASHGLFGELARDAGLDPDLLPGPVTPARTEDEAARLVAQGKADAAFGLATSAAALGLGFVALLEERFDLLVWRHAWFEPPFQRLVRFFATPPFRERAAEMLGYDVTGIGTVHFNGTAP